MMKILLSFFITVTIINTSYSQNNWIKIPSPVSTTLTDCYFLDRNTGWVSGDSGKILKTTNSGLNWTQQNTGTFYNIQEIFFLNNSTGWATAWEIFPDTNSYLGTILLKTTDSGLNWVKTMYEDTGYFMTTIFFRDAMNGYMGGSPATIVYTSNGGSSWNDADIDTTLFVLLPIFKIAFFNDQIGYACGGFRDIAGITWVTTNSGRNWRGSLIAPEPFFDITILYQQKAICSGGDLEYGSSIARTTNQGVDWYYDTLGVFGLATGISSRTKAEIWMAAGYSQKFLMSPDSGFTWISFDTPDNTAVFDVVFPDSLTGFAVGSNGAILKYEGTTHIASNENTIKTPELFYLAQNYPNPFNPLTVLEFGLTKSGYVSLKVYDLLGKEISTLINENKIPGRYSVEFDGTGLPSGVYLYTFEIDGNTVDTKRMILLK